MSYVLSTTVSGVPHCVQCDVDNDRFILVPVQSESQLSKVFVSPNNTGAYSLLDWINKHDKKLKRKQITVTPEAVFRK